MVQQRQTWLASTPSRKECQSRMSNGEKRNDLPLCMCRKWFEMAAPKERKRCRKHPDYILFPSVYYKLPSTLPDPLVRRLNNGFSLHHCKKIHPFTSEYDEDKWADFNETKSRVKRECQCNNQTRFTFSVFICSAFMRFLPPYRAERNLCRSHRRGLCSSGVFTM